LTPFVLWWLVCTHLAALLGIVTPFCSCSAVSLLIRLVNAALWFKRTYFKVAVDPPAGLAHVTRKRRDGRTDADLSKARGADGFMRRMRVDF
jgi:hypothetical protein